MELLEIIGELILDVFIHSKNRFFKAVFYLVSGLMVLLLLSLFVIIIFHSYQNNHILMLIVSSFLTLGLFGFIIYMTIQVQRRKEQNLHNIS
jgi:hypothetical protein